ncbi:aspartic proteinase NANA, chloroplast-like [Typha angustifolia]|uniref:aspartic proteinase NANA, chloroplast-like n=1 Tax=Typha angustifolia TaxID=59011 RepID=UPI003C2ECC8C
MVTLFFFFFFLLLLLFLSSSVSSHSQPYFKLPLTANTPFISATEALIHDSLRLSSSSLTAPIVSAASSGAGHYVASLHLGTPPQLLRLVADTGSDLVWSRCSPSSRPRSSSAFFPRLSSSFSPFHCYDSSCRLVPHPHRRKGKLSCPRSRLHSPCRFLYSYSDGSASSGFFSRETLTLTSSTRPIRIPSFRFGCAFNVTADRSIHGVLGLGRGPISFPSFAALRFGNSFSYCLGDYALSPPLTSFLVIGRRNSTAALRYTPLLSNPLSPTYYYVGVVSASLNGKVLPIDPAVWALDRATGAGGVVVDSGTTLSFLPAAAYRCVVRALAKRLPRAAQLPGPAGFDLCLNASAAARIPSLAFRLRGGAEFAPPPLNYFIEAAEGVKCLALQPVAADGPGFGVIGNLMQQGFAIEFDRVAGRLGFAWTGCAE